MSAFIYSFMSYWFFVWLTCSVCLIINYSFIGFEEGSGLQPGSIFKDYFFYSIIYTFVPSILFVLAYIFKHLTSSKGFSNRDAMILGSFTSLFAFVFLKVTEFAGKPLSGSTFAFFIGFFFALSILVIYIRVNKLK